MHTLQAKTRPAGKAGALRRDGFVPGVVYGPSIESTPVAVEQKKLHGLFSKITRSSRINLAIEDGGEAKIMDVFLKVVDYDELTDEPMHVDFYHPDEQHPLKLEVPIKIVGEARGVKTGGILNILFNSVPVLGLPKDIPHLITIDVSDLATGQSVHARDIDFGEVESLLPPERTLVSVVAPRGVGLAEGEAAGPEEGAELFEVGEGAVSGEMPSEEASAKEG